MKYSIYKKIALILFIIYLIILIWVVVLKFQLSLSKLPNLQHINLIPFGDSSYKQGQFNTFEVVGNFLIFIPFGVYLNLIPSRFSYVKQLIIMAATSLLFEILQYIFSIGVSDITDLLMNLSGGFTGVLIYSILKKLSNDRKKLDKVLTLLACICTTLMLGLIFTLLMNNL